MIEWGIDGRKILARRTDIDLLERSAMEARINAVEAEGLALQRERALNNAAGREPDEISKAFATLYPQYVGKGFSPDLQAVLAVDAPAEAIGLGYGYLGTEHLVLGVLHEGNPAGLVLQRMGVDLERVRQVVRDMGTYSKSPRAKLELTSRVDELINSSIGEAERLGHPAVTCEHLLLGLSETEGMGSAILEYVGASPTRIKAAVLANQRARSNG